MIGKIEFLFVAPNAGDRMLEVRTVFARAGAGLDGDRYAGERGSWSKSKRPVIRQVSLIELESIERVNQTAATRFLPEDTRRNIVVSGFPLNDLIGHEFFVGSVLMRGVELCDPCERPSKLSGKKGFAEYFAGCGGLRAEVLGTGFISVGDTMRLGA